MKLASLLTPRALDDETFEIEDCPHSKGRLLGGALLASSLLAASRTVADSHQPVALQASFLAGGRPGDPVRLGIAGVHQGRTLSIRRIDARQGERLLATSTIRFQKDEPYDDSWQDESREAVASPEEGRREHAIVATMDVLADFEIRATRASGQAAGKVLHPFWIRAPRLADRTVVLHRALLALLSDIGVSASALPPGTSFRERRRALSLDHSLWWHRPVQVDQWLRLDARPLINDGGRGFVRGTVHDLEGRLLASFVQEVLLRLDGS